MPRYKGITAGLIALAVTTMAGATTPTTEEPARFTGVGLVIADQGNRAIETIREEARADLTELNLPPREVKGYFAGTPVALANPPRAASAGGNAATSARASQ